MLSGKILNSDAQLNNFIEIGSKQFIPGSQVKLVFRLTNTELDDLRYIPGSASTIKLTFNKLDGSTLEKTNADITKFTDDRSIMSVVLEESETEELQDGSFSFELDLLGDGTQIEKGVISNALSRVIDGAC